MRNKGYYIKIEEKKNCERSIVSTCKNLIEAKIK